MAGAKDPRTVVVLGSHVGRVEAKGTWRKQAPLPTDRGVLLTLKRGDKVQPVAASDLPERPVYATAPTVKRFSKTR